MKKIDVFTLLFLSAIWGASFLFMRVASDDFGPVALIFLRMFSAFLSIGMLIFNRSVIKKIFENIGPLILLGLFNQVLPFTLIAFSTTRLEAGFTSLLNSTTPIFTAIVGAVLFSVSIKRNQIIGLSIALLGIFILTSNRLDFGANGEGWAIIASLTACVCYAWAANFTRRLSHLSSTEMSLGSMLASSLILSIPAWLYWPEVNPDAKTWTSAILLGVLCTGFAFLLFYRLLRSAGPVPSTTVTILVPIFAIIWGVLLLGETLTVRMGVGMILALGGTAIALQLVKLPFLSAKAETP